MSQQGHEEASTLQGALTYPSRHALPSGLRIFIDSCETGEGAWTGMTEKLKSLYELSDKRHILTSDPDAAHLILIGDVRPQQQLPLAQWGKKILEHQLINKYPNKSFSLSHAEHPLILHHGIYTSGVKSLFTLGRVRTGSYALYNDEYLNPYIRGHRFSPQERVGKDYLMAFIGRRFDGPRWKPRNAIFDLKFTRVDVFIEDSTDFDLWDPQRNSAETVKRQKRYYDVLLRTKFSLCPRGGGTNSLRLFESMQLGIAPIIISDQWILPRGPRWDDFSIFVKEKDMKHMEKIVQDHEPAWAHMGHLARRAFETYFAEDAYFNYVVDNCLDMMRSQAVPEALCWRLNRTLLAALRGRERLKLAATRARGKVRAGMRRAISTTRPLPPLP
jgi:Exostosin family